MTWYDREVVSGQKGGHGSYEALVVENNELREGLERCTSVGATKWWRREEKSRGATKMENCTKWGHRILEPGMHVALLTRWGPPVRITVTTGKLFLFVSSPPTRINEWSHM